MLSSRSFASPCIPPARRISPLYESRHMLQVAHCPKYIGNLSSSDVDLSGLCALRAHFPRPSVIPAPGRLLAAGASPSPQGPTSEENRATDLKDEASVGPTADTSPLVRFAWYASEAFGKAAALVRGTGREEEGAGLAGDGETLSRTEAVEALKKDYDQSYFVTGVMTMDLYEPDCEFADPFVSFRGRDRFKQNVSNLGSFMEDVNLKILDWQETEDKVTTKWRFSCVLGLPWRPILAASGGTDHFFDKKSGRIVKHVERWDISPVDGLRQLVKPNPKFRKRQD